MKLWHQNLIKFLPNKELKEQHCDCCRMRGGWWGRGHVGALYVWRYNPYLLSCYHDLVVTEMEKRGFYVNPDWHDPYYRGGRKKATWEEGAIDSSSYSSGIIYPEHDLDYFKACAEKLRALGVQIPIYDWVFVSRSRSR